MLLISIDILYIVNNIKETTLIKDTHNITKYKERKMS